MYLPASSSTPLAVAVARCRMASASPFATLTVCCIVACDASTVAWRCPSATLMLDSQ